jgi:hypothetical protein
MFQSRRFLKKRIRNVLNLIFFDEIISKHFKSLWFLTIYMDSIMKVFVTTRVPDYERKGEFDGLPVGILEIRAKEWWKDDSDIFFLPLVSSWIRTSKINRSSLRLLTLRTLWFFDFSSSLPQTLWSHRFILWMIRCWNCRILNSMMMIPSNLWELWSKITLILNCFRWIWAFCDEIGTVLWRIELELS